MAGRVNVTDKTTNEVAKGIQSGTQTSNAGIHEITPEQVSAGGGNQISPEPSPQSSGQSVQEINGSDLAQRVLNRAANPPTPEEIQDKQRNYSNLYKEAAGLDTEADSDIQPAFDPSDAYFKYQPTVPKATGEAALISEFSADDVKDQNTMFVIDTESWDKMVERPERPNLRPSGRQLTHTDKAISAVESQEEKQRKEQEEAEKQAIKTVDGVKKLLKGVDRAGLSRIEKMLEGDTRKGVIAALDKAHARLDKEEQSLPNDNPQNSAITSPAPQFRATTNPITEEIDNTVDRGASKQIENQAKAEIKKRWFGGVAVSDKLGGDPTLEMDEIAVGRDIIEEVLRIPRSGLLKRVEEEVGITFDPNSPTFVDDVVFAINTSNIKIASTKPPVNALSSYQSRVLRIRKGRGIKLHPIMAKLYNADYDGDDISASFVLKFSKRAVEPMSVLFDQKGELLLDPGFFPWATLVGSFPIDGMQQTYEEWMRNYAFERRTPEDADYLAELLGKYCGESKDAELKEKYLADYMRGVFKVASKYGRDSYKVAADILKDTYDGLRYLQHIQAQHLNPEAITTLYDDMPQPKTADDYAILKITEDLVVGGTPINFQAFKEKMAAYVGEGGANKNLAFRFTANIAKMFRFDDKLVFKSDEDFYEVYSKLMAYAASKKISNAECAAFRAQAASETLRQTVISKVKFPAQAMQEALDAAGADRWTPDFAEAVFKQWLGNFIREYQKVSAAINLANQRLYADFNIEFGGEDIVRNIKGITIGDAVTPFIQVFGNYSMYHVFGNILQFDRTPAKFQRQFSGRHNTGFNWIDLNYKDKTVKNFAKYNKIKAGQAARYASSKKKAIGEKDAGGLNDFINALANNKTSSAAAFDRQVYSGMDSMCNKLIDIMKDLNNILAECDKVGSNLPLNESSNTIIACIRAFGGELFDHFGMSNMKGFLSSEYGQLLLDAKDEDQIGGIRMTMLIDQAMSRVNTEVDKRAELVKAGASTSRLMKADNAVTSELNALANRSPAYRAIVKELTIAPELRGWNQVMAMVNEEPDKRLLTKLYGNDLQYKDKDGVMRGTGVAYWSDPRHDNLIDFLMDPTVGANEKRCVLADVVRFHEKYGNMTQYEISAQLEEDNSPSFTSMKSGAKSIFDVSRDFNGRHNSWKKRKREDLRKDIKKARENHKGELRSYFKFLADNPEMHVQFPDPIFYDALNSALDKQYGQSEKSKQHSAVNALFAALSYCLHGGVFSDVFRTDDRILGQKSVDKISYQELARLFAYPGTELRVYDRYGQPVTLTAEVLIGVPNPKESDVWDWMMAHPNVAAGFRMHRMHVKNFGNGGAYMAVDRGLNDSMSYCLDVDMSTEERLREKALYYLRDRPGFGALVSGLAHTYNKPSRLMREEYKKAEKLALELVYKYAITYDKTKGFPRLVLDKNGKGFSLTQSVRNATWTKTIKDEVTGDKVVLKEDADSMDESIQTTLELCAKDLVRIKVAGSVSLVAAFESAGALKAEEIDLTDYKYQIKDKQSFSSYFDIRQELNGAKTQISTGVEGTTTHMLFPWVALLAPKDKYADFTNIPREDWDLLKGARTNIKDGAGYVIIGDDLSGADSVEEHIETLIDLYGDDFVVEVPDWYIVKDKTSSTNPNRQLCSVASWLMTKRDDGAEKHNLKIKKFGSDKWNSITSKHPRYTKSKNLLKEVKKAFESETDPKIGRIVATQYLAEVIRDANAELGYDDLTLANCMCIADLMILETNDSRILVLRSIEQLATAIRNQIPSDMVDRANFVELASAAQSIAAQVGLHEVVNPNEALARIRVMAKSWFHPVINETVSSYERNYNLLDQIVKETGVSVHSQKWLDSVSKGILGNNKKNLSKDKNLPSYWGSYSPVGIVGGVYHESPGFKSLLIMDKGEVDGKSLDEDIVRKAMNKAYKLGNTVYVSEDCINYLQPELKENLVPWKDGYILPMFDMRLNGLYNHTDGGYFAIFQADPDRVVNMYEDEINEYSLGDSMAMAFRALVNRLKPRWNVVWEIRKEDLFRNALAEYPDADVTLSFASSVTIEKYIVNGFTEEFEIDYGMPQGTPGFADHKERIDALINEYRREYQYADANGQMQFQARAGQIIGWAEATIFDPSKMSAPKHVLAPIIPFDMRSKMSAPTKYNIDSLTIDNDENSGLSSIQMNCHYSGGLLNHYVKMHEGAGAANKNMVWFGDVEGLNFMDGTPIDGCYAAETTKSRRGGTDRRIKTMETMMFFARKRRYNFAEVEGSFPDDNELKMALQAGRLNRDFWSTIVDGEGASRIDLYLRGQYKFHTDPEINAFLISEVQKFWDNGGTPSDYLANRFVQEDENGEKTYYASNIYWEFSCMFEQNYKYQDMWMKFHHLMDKELCPNGFEDPEITGKELFLPVMNKENFEEHGVMRMMIPRRSADNPNEIFWLRGCVFSGWSFFGEDFSAMKRPSVNGSESTMETQVTMFLAGENPSNGEELRNQLKWGLSDLADVEDMALYRMDMDEGDE